MRHDKEKGMKMRTKGRAGELARCRSTNTDKTSRNFYFIKSFVGRFEAQHGVLTNQHAIGAGLKRVVKPL